MESDLEAAMKSVMESVPGFDKELLDILACPACRGPLAPWPSKDLFSREERTGRADWAERVNLEEQGHGGMPEGLACPACALVYPVRDSIPVLLLEEAYKFNR